jgi:hypothetical protein
MADAADAAESATATLGAPLAVKEGAGEETSAASADHTRGGGGGNAGSDNGGSDNGGGSLPS